MRVGYLFLKIDRTVIKVLSGLLSFWKENL